MIELPQERSKRPEKSKVLNSQNLNGRCLNFLMDSPSYPKACLSSLPTELLQMIVQHMFVASDINALCRVDRYMYYRVNPLLYQHDVNYGGSSALLWAAKEDQKKTLRLSILFKSSSNTKKRALWDAAVLGHKEIVNILVASGVNIDAPETDHPFDTPLLKALPTHFYDNLDQLHVYYIWMHDCVYEVAALTLVACGANVMSTGSDGNTILHRASFYGLHTIVAKCLRMGANVNLVNNHGHTALHCAVAGFAEAIKSPATINLLLAHGADIGILDSQGRTPVDIWTGMKRQKASELVWGSSGDPIEWERSDYATMKYTRHDRSLWKDRPDSIDREVGMVNAELKVSALLDFALQETKLNRQCVIPERQCVREKRSSIEVIISKKEINERVWLAELREDLERRARSCRSPFWIQRPVFACRMYNSSAQIHNAVGKWRTRMLEVGSIYEHAVSSRQGIGIVKTLKEDSLEYSGTLNYDASHYHAALVPLRSKRKRLKSLTCYCCGLGLKIKRAFQCLDCGERVCLFCTRLALAARDQSGFPDQCHTLDI